MSAPPVSCAWAPWWTPEQLRDFLNHVESVVQARFGEHTVDEAEGTVTVEDMDCVLGLSNLAQTCRAVDSEDWRLIIYGHVARLDDFAPDLLAERLGNYEQLQPDLRVRVVGAHHLNQIDAVSDPLPLGLSACLSVDLDGAACPVDRSYFSEWGVEQGEVMAAALANTLMDEPLTPLEGDDAPEQFQILTGDTLFVTGHLLDFGRTVPDIGDMGAVITVPAAHTVMVCPVELDEQFVDNSATMLAASYIRYLAGPNSVSPNALWWRPGHPMEGFARLDDQAFELVAPEPLRSQLWNNLKTKRDE
ncbi:MAG: hypothetical protein F4124_07735 [Acidimicrobiia bacterium]|nr:hypothetical protein [Acidimicrobiia bacterium]MXZ77848.1 hypothetical protein [Acidimicrobiia bacterium]MYB74930.1 hypothetical protein [Acidimicrobiia bacterium]MYE74609.1 hypothetical protein [Acidimicrobiia bacterium]MYH99301.1 hypothetical protein [Acidimicrobiia bacterium]